LPEEGRWIEVVLSAIQGLRADIRSDLSAHVREDADRFRDQGEEIQALRDSHNMARGFIYAVLTVQGIIVTALAIVQVTHILKHP